MPVRGNHERYWDKNTGDECNGLYMEQFNLPSNGNAAYYSFEYGDALFVILDGGCADGTAQRAWMESLFQTNTKVWRFVFIHTPFYCTGGHGGADLNPLTNALIEQYEVNAAFSGHSHSLSVNHPIDDGQIVGSYADGVLYYNTAGTNYNSDRDDATEAKPFQSYLQPPNGQDPYPHSNSKPLATMVHVTGSSAQVVTHDYYNNLILHTVDLPPRRATGTAGARARTNLRHADVHVGTAGHGTALVHFDGDRPQQVSLIDLHGRSRSHSVDRTGTVTLRGLARGLHVLRARSGRRSWQVPVVVR
jgi:hypothetical protein